MEDKKKKLEEFFCKTAEKSKEIFHDEYLEKVSAVEEGLKLALQFFEKLPSSMEGVTIYYYPPKNYLMAYPKGTRPEDDPIKFENGRAKVGSESVESFLNQLLDAGFVIKTGFGRVITWHYSTEELKTFNGNGVLYYDIPVA